MAAPDKTPVSSFRSLDESEPEDWVDREIASLRQSVEGEAPRPKAPIDVQAESRRRRLHVVRPRDQAPRDPIEARLLQPPRAPLRLLSRARRFVRRRRFDIVFYGLSVGVMIAAVLLTVSIGGR